MGLFDKIKSGIKYVIDYNKDQDRRHEERKADDKYAKKFEELVDAYFNEHAGFYINLCKNNRLNGYEKELVDALFNPFDVDLSDVSLDLRCKILKICSKNQDLINYICKVADCKPEEICFDEFPVKGHTVLFGNLSSLGVKNVMPRYVFGDFELIVSGGNYKGIENIGGSLTAIEGNFEQAFPDLKCVRGHIILPNAYTSLPKLERVGGSIAVCGREDEPYEDLQSLRNVGGKFYILNIDGELNSQWKKFEEERNFHIENNFDSYDAQRWFDKVHLIQLKERATEEVSKEK